MKSIVAVDEKWGIGKNNGLLFDIKADMRHFVEHTRGKIVVMGSNTLLSLPGGMPLKNRVNIVLNPEGSDEDAAEKGYTLVRSLDELLHTVAGYAPDNVYVIGGAMMYRTLLPYCSEAIVTKVRADGVAQVFYENLDLLPEWELAEESAPVSDSGYTMTFCTYRNRSPLPLDGGKGGTDNGGNADGNDKASLPRDRRKRYERSLSRAFRPHGHTERARRTQAGHGQAHLQHPRFGIQRQPADDGRTGVRAQRRHRKDLSHHCGGGFCFIACGDDNDHHRPLHPRGTLARQLPALHELRFLPQSPCNGNIFYRRPHRDQQERPQSRNQRHMGDDNKV